MKLKELLKSEKDKTIVDFLGPLPEVYNGDIKVVKKGITSLEGCSSIITGEFNVTVGYLDTLKGGPHTVGESFLVYSNKLNTLEGGPTKVGFSYACDTNLLKSLVGAPKEIRHNFGASGNQLESLEGVPRRVGGNLTLYRNKFKSLKGIHKHIDYIGGYLDCSENALESHVLGVLRIEGLNEFLIDNDDIQNIINKHLEGDKDIFACQEELIAAGFEEFAQL